MARWASFPLARVGDVTKRRGAKPNNSDRPVGAESVKVERSGAKRRENTLTDGSGNGAGPTCSGGVRATPCAADHTARRAGAESVKVERSGAKRNENTLTDGSGRSSDHASVEPATKIWSGHAELDSWPWLAAKRPQRVLGSSRHARTEWL